MSPPKRPFLERLRTFEEVLDEVSANFSRAYRFTSILDVKPPRVVSVAVERRDLASNRKVYVPASAEGDIASDHAKAELRQRIGDAVHSLEEAQLSLDTSSAKVES